MDHNSPNITLINEKSRLKTFKNWPLDQSSSCNGKKMAEAGFYCNDPINYPDSAECFLCKKQLDGWDEHDNPWVEHINHAKYCLFAQCQKPEKEMTVGNFLEFVYQFSLNRLEATYTEKMKHLESEHEKILNTIEKGKKRK